MKRGSITPFCALSVLLVTALLFALLESARVYGLDHYVVLKAEAGIDSVCAEYQPLLWQEYGLLFLDGAYGTETFSMDYVAESLKTQIEKSCEKEGGLTGRLGQDLFPIKLKKVTLEGFSLAADAQGELFLNYVAERMKEKMPIGIAEDLYEQYTYGKKVQEECQGAQAAVFEAQELLEELKRKNEKNEEDVNDETEDTFWTVLQIQNSGILKTVLGDTAAVSTNVCRMESLESRDKQEGTLALNNNVDWYRKLLVLRYMEEYFSNYRKVKSGHDLDYEMEYVLCGEETEWRNFEEALKRILVVREAGNVCYLLQDEEKMEMANFLANLLGLFAEGNPVAVGIFKTGIIGAWACLESVLDVRSLVLGEQIPLVKNKNEWTTDVGNILTSFRESARAKKCERGLDYEDYLEQQLFLMSDEMLAYRMMEVMEFSMRAQNEYKNCRMNQMLVALKYRLEFESKSIFSSVVTLGESYPEVFRFEKEVTRCYVP